MNDADFKKYQTLKDNLRQGHNKKNRSDFCKKHMKNVESNSSLESLVDPEVETSELTGDFSYIQPVYNLKTIFVLVSCR
jgi:hypothetical protein